MVGWAGLGLAIASGVRIHMVWSKFFAVTQKYLNKGLTKEAQVAREKCHMERRFFEVILLITFLVGVAGVIGFTAANLKNVALKTDDSSNAQKAPANRAADTGAIHQGLPLGTDHATGVKHQG